MTFYIKDLFLFHIQNLFVNFEFAFCRALRKPAFLERIKETWINVHFFYAPCNDWSSLQYLSGPLSTEQTTVKARTVARTAPTTTVKTRTELATTPPDNATESTTVDKKPVTCYHGTELFNPKTNFCCLYVQIPFNSSESILWLNRFPIFVSIRRSTRRQPFGFEVSSLLWNFEVVCYLQTLSLTHRVMPLL